MAEALIIQHRPEKGVLAAWLRQPTTVSLRWVAKRLYMGHYVRAHHVDHGWPKAVCNFDAS